MIYNKNTKNVEFYKRIIKFLIRKKKHFKFIIIIFLLLLISFKKKNILIPIKLGIYTHSLKNGGVERNSAILINYLSTIKNFEIHLFNRKKSNNEYKIPINVKRKIIEYKPNILKRNLIAKKINIFIYQLYDQTMIEMLKSLKNLKIIYYIHSCFLYWIYKNDSNIFNNIYNEYRNSKYVISIIHFENDYLFKKWGIHSIYMDNFLTYQYENIIQSDLSSNNILMIGRASDKNKRFFLGIKSMKYIKREIPEVQMIIISDDKEISNLKNLVKILNLGQNVKFTGYTAIPEVYFKKASLHIFPSISEAFPMILSETKIYGIPNILLGIDYVSNSKDGVIIIYDEKPETISKYALKILKNKKYRKLLGKEARKSMKKYDNELLFKRWVKLILEINKGEDSYLKLIEENKKITENESIYILDNQIKLLKKRIPKFKNLTINNILNFSFIKNIYYL